MFGIGQLGRLGSVGRAISAWTPAKLWPLGATSPGMWIDPPYVASLYQDIVGTTAISAIGTVLDTSNPVGLALDRKGNLALGAELVTNGDFATDTDWIKSAGVTISGGAAVWTAAGSNAQVYQIDVMTVGLTYEVTYTITTLSAGGLKVSAGAEGSTYSAPGTYTARLRATDTTIHIYAVGASTTAAVSEISVKEIPGIHLSQATATSRGVASARANLLSGTATLSTQNVTVAAIPHTITFSGGGTVTASGTFVGALTSGQTFTPTAGTLTLTVAGSVTSAMLNRGSVGLTYQAVVSASDYDASAGPTYLKFDGVDDSLASATFAAGTLTSSMDCLIAVRRDSSATAFYGILGSQANGQFTGVAESGSGLAASAACGTPTTWVDGVQLTGGTAVTRGTVHTALTPGSFHILEFRNLDLSAWTVLAFGALFEVSLNGALGEIQLFASGQDANRDKARAEMAAYFGVTLP